jgi:hypothetical protein
MSNPVQANFTLAPGRNRKEENVIKSDRPEYDERAFKKGRGIQ